jgi:amidase
MANGRCGARRAVPAAKAEHRRAALYARVLQFFETYDLLVSPCRAVPTLDVELRHPQTIDG